jgi:lipopolysaccharide biosynthesis glycosyltransferase
MNQSRKPRLCFATVTNESFAVGAEVLIHSFLNFNRWFEGDILVVEAEQLSEQTRERLNRLYPVRFANASEQLTQKIDRLEQVIPWLKKKRAHFHVFELFGMVEYDHIVYVDGDAYCCGDISNLFVQKETLQACPDGFSLRAKLWEKLGTHAPEVLPDAKPYGPDIKHSFNSGVLAMSQPVISQKTYLELISLLDPGLYENSEFGDQMALNVYFKDKYTPFSAAYNYMILVEEYIKGLENITYLDARIIHFAGKIKPWFNFDSEELFRAAPQYLKYIETWKELFYQCRFKDDNAFYAQRVAAQRKWSKEQLQTFDWERFKRIY